MPVPESTISAQPMPAANAKTTLAAAAMASLAGPKFAEVPWLAFDIYRELAAVFRMFFDLHYRVAWSTRMLTLLLLPAILTSAWWLPFSGLPIFGTVLDKIFDLVLALVVFKALSREARRYMEARGPV